jgi:hypothetical protein
MPLSDHEQRILDDIERRLAAEDPKFARSTAVATPRGVALRRIKRAIGAFSIGLVLLVTALTIGLGKTKFVVPIGLAAFVIMLLSVNVIARASKEIGRAPGAEKESWLARQEERWRKRFERGEER